MFVHFGINTFADTEWSGWQPAHRPRYNPTALDPDQWVRVAREAGFRYVLLTTKRHDGFWPLGQQVHDYDVAGFSQ